MRLSRKHSRIDPASSAVQSIDDSTFRTAGACDVSRPHPRAVLRPAQWPAAVRNAVPAVLLVNVRGVPL